jgi:hypothetical protein
MTTTAKKRVRSRRSAPTERTVVYRGIKIAPMSGRRSALAQAIREALRTRTRERSHGESAEA